MDIRYIRREDYDRLAREIGAALTKMRCGNGLAILPVPLPEEPHTTNIVRGMLMALTGVDVVVLPHEERVFQPIHFPKGEIPAKPLTKDWMQS